METAELRALVQRKLQDGRFANERMTAVVAGPGHGEAFHDVQIFLPPDDIPLVSSGLIDSMTLVNVLLKLEDVTHMRIPGGKVQLKDMDMVDLMFTTAQRVGKPGNDSDALRIQRATLASAPYTVFR